MTIYESLRRKLGRIPTHQEQVEEIKRIISEAKAERLARAGRFSQRAKSA